MFVDGNLLEGEDLVDAEVQAVEWKTKRNGDRGAAGVYVRIAGRVDLAWGGPDLAPNASKCTAGTRKRSLII